MSERNTANTADVDVGNVDIRFDLTGLGSVNAGDLRLLLDANNDGLFNDDSPISGATAIGSNVYQFTAVSGAVLANRRFTLATINSITTPLPIGLIFFSALADNGSVLLKWATATENNSDYFEVQRSTDGITWQSRSQVEATGNSTNTINYYTTDLINGITGEIYYRLKEVDLNGNATYSGIQEINAVNKKQLQTFPSPAQNILYVQTTNSGEKLSGMFNTSGQNVLPD